MHHVVIATCSGYPVADEDQPLLTAALEALGVEASTAVWSDASVDWDRFDLVVIRSTWDYTKDLEGFRSWVGSLHAVCNPAAVVTWNTDKRYLDDLDRLGVPVIPTTYARSADEVVIPDAERFVVKPTVGAGSLGARRFERHEVAEARAHVESLSIRGLESMVQPYLEGVDALGETAVIILDGTPSHAIGKAALLGVSETDRSGLFRSESIRPRQASASELEVARRALAAALEVTGEDHALLYARVDLLPTPEGPVVIELELTEPSLFLRLAPGAAERLADAIVRRLEVG